MPFGNGFYCQRFGGIAFTTDKEDVSREDTNCAAYLKSCFWYVYMVQNCETGYKIIIIIIIIIITIIVSNILKKLFGKVYTVG